MDSGFFLAESESKAGLDRFCDAMISIHGDRNLVCTCDSVEAYAS